MELTAGLKSDRPAGVSPSFAPLHLPRILTVQLESSSFANFGFIQYWFDIQCSKNTPSPRIFKPLGIDRSGRAILRNVREGLEQYYA